MRWLASPGVARQPDAKGGRTSAGTRRARHRSVPSGVALVLAIVLGSAGVGLCDEADLDPGIRFTARNLVSTADGSFHEWRVTAMDADLGDPASGWVEVAIDLASVDTGSERRDEHLRTEDFFDVEKYPTAKVRVHDARPLDRSENGHRRYQAK